jgi:hypothetical protein
MIMKKKAMNMNCCWVPDNVEMKSARPRIAVRNIVALRKRSPMLPSKGTSNSNLPSSIPTARSMSPIMRNGTILAIMK